MSKSRAKRLLSDVDVDNEVLSSVTVHTQKKSRNDLALDDPHVIAVGVYESLKHTKSRQVLLISSTNTLYQLATCICDQVLPGLRSPHDGGMYSMNHFLKN